MLLLANVFESFRDMFMEYYALDLAHVCTAPGLPWQAALKLTDIERDL